jgi:hypothetical protein
MCALITLPCYWDVYLTKGQQEVHVPAILTYPRIGVTQICARCNLLTLYAYLGDVY